MIHDPILLIPIVTTRRCGKARVSHTVGLLHLILIEHAPVVLPPILGVHRIGADKLKLPETVIGVVRTGGGVDDELLGGVGVRELFWGFVGGEADVRLAAVGGLFPGLGGG